MKQFRVELGLKVAQEKRSWPLSIQRVVSFNVKLCQQKLYKTMFDRASGTSGLGANFPACRKHHRRRPELPPPERKGPGAFQSRGKWPRSTGCAAWEEGAGSLVWLEGPPGPRPVPLPRTQPGGGAGGGAKAACRETWGGGRGALPAGSFVAQPRPTQPYQLLLLQGGSSMAPPSRNSFAIPGVLGTGGVSELA